MFFEKKKLFLKISLTVAIGLCSIAGDSGLKYGDTAVMRGLFDNVTHATVGGLTWALILLLSKKSLTQNLQSIILSSFLSSFIDVDHFISARSWKLHDAANLEKRPFLHSTTVPIFIWVILMTLSKICDNEKLSYYSWLICASFLSHHIRDGARRGLWFNPIGSTRPIPYYMYICLAMALPYILYSLMTFSVFVLKVKVIETPLESV